MICVGFVVVDVFPFFVSSHSSTPDLEMTEKNSDAFIESVFDSLYKKCHPISLNVVFPKAAALSDQVLEVIIKGGVSIDERLSKLIISSL